MGSFNTACMVSQQVIVPGAEAVILPIHQQATYRPVELVKDNKEISQYGFAHTTCYPTAFWGYSGPIIRGKYYDYGCFEIFNIEENRINMISFFNHLFSDSFITKEGENKCHDVSFNMSSLYNPKKEYSFEELQDIWNKIWEVSQENRLFVSDYQGHPRNLQFAVMHRAAADYLIDYVNKANSYEDISYEQKTYFKHYIQGQLDRMIKVFENKKELGDTFSFFASQLTSLSGYRLGEQEGCHISYYYDNWELVMNAVDDFRAKNEDLSKLSDELIETLFDLFKSQIDHRYIQVGLNWLNIKLSPMVYASQDYDNSTGKSYAKMIRSVGAQINKEIKANRD